MAMQQYAERYPIGQRNIKMLDDTLESATAGLSSEAIFQHVFHPLVQSLTDYFSCGVKEILDPDYLPGSLKTIPQMSVLTPADSNALPSSSTSSAKISIHGLPATPDSDIIEKAKLRGRTNSLRQGLNNHNDQDLYGTRYRVDASIQSFDSGIEHNAFEQAGYQPVPSSSGHLANQTNQASSFPPPPSGFMGKAPSLASDPLALTPDTQVTYQNFMAMAMGLGLNPGGPAQENGVAGMEGGGGGDFGFGFDINNFSFDVGDFSALLGQPQAEWDGTDQGQNAGTFSM
jgi:hypothetical protein